MSNQLATHSSTPIALPAARVDIRIRPGVLDDVAFMDALQKKTTKQVGFMPRMQFEGKIKLGHVLVAEVASGQWPVASKDGESHRTAGPAALATGHSSLATPTPVGYLIGNDQYFKRDDVGIIYQINVLPEFRRSLVAANLLKAQFDRSAYGCRLYCCWCAQDIEANKFWENMGFVALAFRTGGAGKKVASGQWSVASEGKGGKVPTGHSQLATGNSSRVHIFWQKRIRSGDTSTPWWFPSQTSGGSIREDRIVLPIPPGVRWSDEMPRILPGQMNEGVSLDVPLIGAEMKLIGEGTVAPEFVRSTEPTTAEMSETTEDPSTADEDVSKTTEDVSTKRTRRRKRAGKVVEAPVPVEPVKRRGRVCVMSSGPCFEMPVVEDVQDGDEVEQVKKVRVKPARKPKQKNDPRHVQAARTVGARWQEEVQRGNITIEPAGKYELTSETTPLLAA